MFPFFGLVLIALIIFVLFTKQKINTYSWDWWNDDYVLNTFDEYCKVVTVTSKIADFHIYNLQTVSVSFLYLMNSNTAEPSSITDDYYNFKHDDIRYLGPGNFEKDIYDGALSLQGVDTSGWGTFDSFSTVSNTVRATFSYAPGEILFCATEYT